MNFKLVISDFPYLEQCEAKKIFSVLAPIYAGRSGCFCESHGALALIWSVLRWNYLTAEPLLFAEIS